MEIRRHEFNVRSKVQRGWEGPKSMENNEIDIFEFSERGEDVPHAAVYRVRIDGELVKVETASPDR